MQPLSSEISAFPILRQRLPFWSLYWSRVGGKDIFWCFFAHLNLCKTILIVEIESFVKLLLFLCQVVKMDTKRQLRKSMVTGYKLTFAVGRKRDENRDL